MRTQEKDDGIKQYLKNETLRDVFEIIKCEKRHRRNKEENHFNLLPGQLRMLFYGSGRLQFLDEKAIYFKGEVTK